MFVATCYRGTWQARRFVSRIQLAHPESKRFSTMASALGYAARMNATETYQCSPLKTHDKPTVITPPVSSALDAPTTCVRRSSTPCSGIDARLRRYVSVLVS